MTPEEQKIAIVKACGWAGIRGETGYPTAAAELAGNYYTIPDYLNDRDAIHAEIDKLTPHQQQMLYHEVTKVLRSKKSPRTAWRATAEDLCEAFLKTLNLWIN